MISFGRLNWHYTVSRGEQTRQAQKVHRKGERALASVTASSVRAPQTGFASDLASVRKAGRISSLVHALRRRLGFLWAKRFGDISTGWRPAVLIARWAQLQFGASAAARVYRKLLPEPSGGDQFGTPVRYLVVLRRAIIDKEWIVSRRALITFHFRHSRGDRTGRARCNKIFQPGVGRLVQPDKRSKARCSWIGTKRYLCGARDHELKRGAVPNGLRAEAH